MNLIATNSRQSSFTSPPPQKDSRKTKYPPAFLFETLTHRDQLSTWCERAPQVHGAHGFYNRGGVRWRRSQ